jgi:hypothetical protein
VVDDADGNPVLATRYERTEAGEYTIEEADPRKLADWIGPVDLEEPIRLPVLDVTVEPRFDLRALANGVNFVKACLFLRGSAAFGKSWALVASFLALSILTWLVSVGSGLLLPSIDIGGPLAVLLGAISLATVGGIAWSVGAIRGLLADLVSSLPETSRRADRAESGCLDRVELLAEPVVVLAEPTVAGVRQTVDVVDPLGFGLHEPRVHERLERAVERLRVDPLVVVPGQFRFDRLPLERLAREDRTDVPPPAALEELGHSKAGMPVRSAPRISVWMSWVPS